MSVEPSGSAAFRSRRWRRWCWVLAGLLLHTKAQRTKPPPGGVRAWLRVAPRLLNVGRGSGDQQDSTRGPAGLDPAAQQRPPPTSGTMCASWLSAALLLGTLCAGKDRADRLSVLGGGGLQPRSGLPDAALPAALLWFCSVAARVNPPQRSGFSAVNGTWLRFGSASAAAWGGLFCSVAFSLQPLQHMVRGQSRSHAGL